MEPTSVNSPPPSTMRKVTAHTADTYTALKTTALAFLAAQEHRPALSPAMDLSALRSATAADYTHTFGPCFSVAQAPALQGEFDFARFRAHLEGMLPVLERWEIGVEGVVVDVAGRSVVVRARYDMFVRGVEEGVGNEVVWWLELEEGEDEGWKVRRSVEIVDFGAAARIRELVSKIAA